MNQLNALGKWIRNHIAVVVIVTLAILGIVGALSVPAPSTSEQLGSIFAVFLGLGGYLGIFYGIRALFRAAQHTVRQSHERITEAESRVEKQPELAKPAWDLARVTLESYFDRNLLQITLIFYLSVSVMIVGFGIVAVGVWQAIYSTTTWAGPVASAVGLITEFIGGTFLFIYRSAIEQATSYSQTLERINSVGMAMQILDTMPDDVGGEDLKSKTKSILVQLLVQQANFASHPVGVQPK